MHTNTSSQNYNILTMKTSHNLNNAMHAHDSLFVHCEAYPLFINVFMLYALQFKLFTPILCKIMLSSNSINQST
jgi:hypothetical protein